MSILDRHPAPLKFEQRGYEAFAVDANGLVIQPTAVMDAWKELAATRTEWFRSNTELAAAIAENARLREACREMLKVVDDCYAATGHFKVSETSEQRLRIEAALQESRDAAKV